jgi:hypothetical protein
MRAATVIYVNAQTPSRHTPDPQTLPQVPQLRASKRRSTHRPLQHVSEPSVALFWQHVTDEPERHTWSFGQQ